MNKEPEYYSINGLSPLNAMKNGLISKKEYEGFLKGNIIKYIARSDYKSNKREDLLKAKNYLNELIELTEEELLSKEPIG